MQYARRIHRLEITDLDATRLASGIDFLIALSLS